MLPMVIGRGKEGQVHKGSCTSVDLAIKVTAHASKEATFLRLFRSDHIVKMLSF